MSFYDAGSWCFVGKDVECCYAFVDSLIELNSNSHMSGIVIVLPIVVDCNEKTAIAIDFCPNVIVYDTV